jgi:hypothetical protein
MGAVATRGNVAFAGDATPALTYMEFKQDEFVVTADSAQASASTSIDAFKAVGHEHRITNRRIVACEEDLPINSIAGTTAAAGERYHGPRGRLLAFKNTR